MNILIGILIIFIILYFVVNKKPQISEKMSNIQPCDKETRFVPIKDEYKDYCDNLELKQLFIITCKDNIYPQDATGDCEGRNVKTVWSIDYKNNIDFKLYSQDEDTKNIKAISIDEFKDYIGDIGIDVNYKGNEIRMDDVKLSNGIKTSCGYKYKIPVKDGNEPKCNFIFNFNKI